MINTRPLTSPSPADGNLRTGIDPLGMLREGSYDLNRYHYFHGKFSQNNRTKIMEKNSNIFSGGIVTFPVPPTELANHPISFRNALTDAPLPVYDLYHSPSAPQFNPIAVTLDTDFIKKYNTPIALK